MRIGELLLLGTVVAGATLAMEAPAVWAQEMERVPARLSAFLPRTPLPTSDDDGAGCRGMPGTRHGRCEGDEFCGTLLSSEGRKGRRLSGMLDELGGRRIHWGAQNGPAPTKMLIHLEGAHPSRRCSCL